MNYLLDFLTDPPDAPKKVGDVGGTPLTKLTKPRPAASGEGFVSSVSGQGGVSPSISPPEPGPVLDYRQPLPWRPVVAAWPTDRRKAFGARAVELMGRGKTWDEAEVTAFLELIEYNNI